MGTAAADDEAFQRRAADIARFAACPTAVDTQMPLVTAAFAICIAVARKGRATMGEPLAQYRADGAMKGLNFRHRQ